MHYMYIYIYNIQILYILYIIYQYLNLHMDILCICMYIYIPPTRISKSLYCLLGQTLAWVGFYQFISDSILNTSAREF